MLRPSLSHSSKLPDDGLPLTRNDHWVRTCNCVCQRVFARRAGPAVVAQWQSNSERPRAVNLRLNLNAHYAIYKRLGTGRLRKLALDIARVGRLRYLNVKIDPNWLCNLSCKMCFFSNRDKYGMQAISPMPPSLFGKIADDIFPRTRLLFLGCGAEPLMSPRFEEYADTVGRFRIPFVALVTNGQLLNERNVLSIIRNRFHLITISICGATKSTYERLHAGGHFDKLMTIIDMIRDLKQQERTSNPQLRFNFTAMKSNADELTDLIRLAEKKDVRTIRIRTLGHWGGVLDYEREMMNHDEYMTMITDAREALIRPNVQLLHEGMYDAAARSTSEQSRVYGAYECIDPWYSVIIRGDGRMRFCTSLQYVHGDFNTQTYSDMERAEPINRARELLAKDPCNSCLCTCKGDFTGL